MNNEQLLELALKAISDRHGEATKAFDMRGVSILADFFVITSASSNRQLHALANSVIDACKESNYLDYKIEGNRQSDWLLIDLGDVIVNIFTEEARDFYGLESLWSAGKELEVVED